MWLRITGANFAKNVSSCKAAGPAGLIGTDSDFPNAQVQLSRILGGAYEAFQVGFVPLKKKKKERKKTTVVVHKFLLFLACQNPRQPPCQR
jgi:hypothetical protein